MFSLTNSNVDLLLIQAAELYLLIVCFHINLDSTIHLVEFLVCYILKYLYINFPLYVFTGSFHCTLITYPSC